MRLAILDTNVVVSAGLKLSSVPFQLVADWVLAGRVQLVTCPSIVSEYREVLLRPKFTRHGFPPAWLEQLIEESLRLPDPPPWTHSVPDAKDAIFLALAHASGAWLVTEISSISKAWPSRRHRAFAGRVSRSPRGMKVLSPVPECEGPGPPAAVRLSKMSKPIAGPFRSAEMFSYKLLDTTHQVSRQWPEWRSSQPLPRYSNRLRVGQLISEVNCGT